MNQASPHSRDCPLSLRESHPTRGARGMTLYIKLKNHYPTRTRQIEKGPYVSTPILPFTWIFSWEETSWGSRKVGLLWS